MQLRGITLPVEEAMVTKRVIHTSADFSYAQTMTYSTGAVETAKWLITGGRGHCDGHQHGALRHQQARARTLRRIGTLLYGGRGCGKRGEGAGRYPRHREHGTGGKDRKPVIFAIGNAPTALIQLYGMIEGRATAQRSSSAFGRVCQCGGGRRN